MILSGEFLLSSLPPGRLAACIDENPSFRGFLHGYISEEKLRDLLKATEGIENVAKIPDHSLRKGDFAFSYLGKDFTIELKNLASRRLYPDILNGGVDGTVMLKSTDTKKISEELTTHHLPRGTFDILAVCTVTLDEQWTFKFILNKNVPSSDLGEDYLTPAFKINTEYTPMLKDNILEVLQDLG
jgi:hypothetical protein